MNTDSVRAVSTFVATAKTAAAIMSFGIVSFDLIKGVLPGCWDRGLRLYHLGAAASPRLTICESAWNSLEFVYVVSNSQWV